MLARNVMVTAIASLVILFGAPKNTLACNKGVPHGNQTSCDGGGGVTPTNFVLLDASGVQVGNVIGVQIGGVINGIDSDRTYVNVLIRYTNILGDIVKVVLKASESGMGIVGVNDLFFLDPACVTQAYFYPSRIDLSFPSSFGEIVGHFIAPDKAYPVVPGFAGIG